MKFPGGPKRTGWKSVYFSTALILYLAVLAVALLWPFNFDFHRTNHAAWLKSASGIEFPQRGQLITAGQDDYVFQRLTRGTGLTIAVWVRPFDSYQNGPARIISYSLNPYLRNFTLGQSRSHLVVRLRTTKTDLSGENPQVEVPDVFDDTRIRNIAVTYNYDREYVWIDGRMRQSEEKVKGNFSNWDSRYPLVIGNEATGDRPWLGEIFYAAIYDRALTGEEILKNFNNGHPPGGLLKKDPEAVVCYLFDERGGSTIFNQAHPVVSTNLHIPAKLPSNRAKPFRVSRESVADDLLSLWGVVNMIGFMPLGFLLCGYLNGGRRSKMTMVLSALLAGFLIGGATEYLDVFLPGRHSSAVELFLKTIGSLLGMACYSEWLGKYLDFGEK